MKDLFLLLLLFLTATTVRAATGPLVTIDQDYNQALEIAARDNKLVFVDFYTIWCAPCKELDKYVFENEAAQAAMADDFVLLRYNAENDKVHHLSKKHHVMSYPTALVLNPQGYVVHRKYGFGGKEAGAIRENVLEFTRKAVDLHQAGHYVKGYSNVIDPGIYPQFYVDYVNRDDVKTGDDPEFPAYWTTPRERMGEDYFSTTIYFATDIPLDAAYDFLAQKESYLDRFGSTDVNLALYLIGDGLFSRAIKAQDAEAFEAAVGFLKASEDDETEIEEALAYYREQYDTKK